MSIRLFQIQMVIPLLQFVQQRIWDEPYNQRFDCVGDSLWEKTELLESVELDICLIDPVTVFPSALSGRVFSVCIINSGKSHTAGAGEVHAGK